jgi:hypothetical protein
VAPGWFKVAMSFLVRFVTRVATFRLLSRRGTRIALLLAPLPILMLVNWIISPRDDKVYSIILLLGAEGAVFAAVAMVFQLVSQRWTHQETLHAMASSHLSEKVVTDILIPLRQALLRDATALESFATDRSPYREGYGLTVVLAFELHHKQTGWHSLLPEISRETEAVMDSMRNYHRLAMSALRAIVRHIANVIDPYVRNSPDLEMPYSGEFGPIRHRIRVQAFYSRADVSSALNSVNSALCALAGVEPEDLESTVDRIREAVRRRHPYREANGTCRDYLHFQSESSDDLMGLGDTWWGDDSLEDNDEDTLASNSRMKIARHDAERLGATLNEVVGEIARRVERDDTVAQARAFSLATAAGARRLVEDVERALRDPLHFAR